MILLVKGSTRKHNKYNLKGYMYVFLCFEVYLIYHMIGIYEILSSYDYVIMIILDIKICIIIMFFIFMSMVDMIILFSNLLVLWLTLTVCVWKVKDFYGTIYTCVNKLSIKPHTSFLYTFNKCYFTW